MEFEEQIGIIKKRLQQALPGVSAQELMAARVVPMPDDIPVNARNSAVLCLLFPANNELHVLLMKRIADNTAHSGQVSFPGGKYESEDGSLQVTALREAYEEVGIVAAEIEILGELTPLYIPVSNFRVHPFVGYLPSRPVYYLNTDEVAYTLELPLSYLFNDSRKTMTDVTLPAMPGVLRKVKAYVLQDNTIIWGATAMILSELEVLINKIH